MRLLALLLLPAWALAGTFVHSASADTAAFCAPPMQATLSVTAGDLLIVGIGSYGTFPNPPTDGVNTYTLAIRDSVGNATASIYYAVAATTASITATVSTCGHWSDVILAEYSGFGALNQTGVAAAAGSATTQSIASATGGLVVSIVFDQTSSTTYTFACSGLAVRTQVGSSATALSGLADSLNTPSGSYSGTWSGWGTSLGIQTVIASFGGSVTRVPRHKTVFMGGD